MDKITDSNDTPKRRLEDHHPAAKIAWDKPGAPAVPAPAAARCAPMRAVASMSVSDEGISIFPTPAAKELARGHYMLSLPEAQAIAAFDGADLARAAEAAQPASTDAELAKLKELALAATPGKWEVNQASAMQNGRIVVDELYVYSPEMRNVAIASDIADPATGEMSKANADYIAAASPAVVLDLIARIETEKQKRQTAQGMADCMCMVHQELVEAGVIEASVPPMMTANAVVAHIARIERAAAPAPSDEGDFAKSSRAELIEYIMYLRAAVDTASGATASGDELPKESINEIGLKLRIQAFENAAYRAAQGGSMTEPEKAEYAGMMAFARAVIAAERAAVSAATKPTADLPPLPYSKAKSRALVVKGDIVFSVDEVEQIQREAYEFGKAQATAAVECIADELTDEAIPYEGDFADTVRGAADALRSLLATKPAAPAVPEEFPLPSSGMRNKYQTGYATGWNACRTAMLAAAPAAPMALEQAKAEPSSIDKMEAIGKLIREQDNRITDQPMFIVQQRRRITGLDTGYCDNIIWLCSEDEYSEASEEEAAKLESEYQETGRERSGWTRTGYMDEWEFVTACFTEQGCKDYLARDGHNLKEPRIYAEGSYRNEEFRAIRNFLIGLCTKAAGAEGAE